MIYCLSIQNPQRDIIACIIVTTFVRLLAGLSASDASTDIIRMYDKIQIIS